MRNLCGIVISVGFLVGCLIGLVSCATSTYQTKTKTLKPVSGANERAHNLGLKSAVGDVEINRYFAANKLKVFKDQEILREKYEAVDFKMKTQTDGVSPGVGTLIQRVTSFDKDGTMDLHSLGVPEEDEELEMHISSEGKVLLAGDYSRSSIFYVPSISLPDEPVKIGDTWELISEWSSEKDHIPLKLELMSLLKGIYHCGQWQCADIELSGQVTMVGVDSKKLLFESEIRGRIILEMASGRVFWSEVKNKERLTTEDSSMLVSGCMKSVAETPKPYFSSKNYECDTDFEVSAPPGL